MAKRSKQRRTVQRDREQIKEILRQAFRRRFPDDTVDVSDGFEENIHVLVVSRKFDMMNERTKQDLMWEIIDDTDLSDEEKGLISLAYPISVAQIK